MIEVTSIPIGKIRANTWNPNQQTEIVKKAERESIERFGMIDPLLVRKTGDTFQIIDGEHRFRACEDLGHDTVPAIVIKAGDVEARKLTVILNDVRGRHDQDLLGALLTDLHVEMDEADFAIGLPYSEDDLARLLQTPDFEPSEPGRRLDEKSGPDGVCPTCGRAYEE